MATSLDTLGLNSTDAAQRNVNTTYAIGLINNNARKRAADVTFDQRIAALQSKLQNEQAQLPNSYARRGVLNSGIYNFNPAPGTTDMSQFGAYQQFIKNSQQSLLNLSGQKTQSDLGFDQGNASLGLAQQDQLENIPGASASDAARQAIADAVKGA